MRRGGRKLIPIAELQRWLAENVEFAIEEVSDLGLLVEM